MKISSKVIVSAACMLAISIIIATGSMAQTQQRTPPSNNNTPPGSSSHKPEDDCSGTTNCIRRFIDKKTAKTECNRGSWLDSDEALVGDVKYSCFHKHMTPSKNQ